MSTQLISRESKEYSKFILSDHNRGVSLPHVNKLRRSMRRLGYLKSFPISCTISANGGLLITDGQHRFSAAKAEGLPIIYVIEKNPVDPSAVPVQKRWNASDYVTRFADAGNQQYVIMRKLASHFRLSVNTTAKLLMDDTSGNRKAEFESGNAQIRKYDEAVSAMVATRRACEGNRTLLPNVLVVSLFRMQVIDSIDYEYALDKIAGHSEQMVRFNSADRGFDEIEKAYNYRTKAENRVPLAMLIRQQLKINKRTFGRQK